MPCLCDGRTDIRCDEHHCDLAGPGEFGNPHQCRVCWLRLKRRRGLNRSPLPCAHLGAETGELLACSTCPGSVRVKAYNCCLHSRCVLGVAVPGAHGCQGCPDRTEPAVIENVGTKRNLLFHLYPLRAGGVWRWHADRLRQHIGLFNGLKVLALAFDSHTEDAAVVKQALSPLFDEVLELSNDASLREVLTFEPLFNRVRSTDPSEVTLYAHGKGVGRHAHPYVRRWSELLYDLNMGRWEDVQKLLVRSPIVGSFKKVGRGWPDSESLADWHYSGSWFWFRHRDLFLRDWREIDRFWSGIESYPALHFKPEHAACLFHEAPVADMNLYDAGVWRDRIEPAYAEFCWQREQAAIPSGLKVELGGGAHPRGGDFIDVDRSTGHDLETDPLPFADDSVAELYSAHCLEHIRNLHHVLQEIVRVCKAGAAVTIIVPHWNSPMALCHDHKQVIPPEQVEHWTKTALAYWWSGCTKRLAHVRTTQAPSGSFAEAKGLFPHLTDEQVMRFVPGAAHEIKYELRVVPHAD